MVLDQTQDSNANKSSLIPDERLRNLDPEGGYEDPDEGFRAELTAMVSQAKLNVNALPTKSYLETTITPTVLRALQEVCECRPDNPLEFVAYYILKHNPNRKTPTEGAPVHLQSDLIPKQQQL
eukprot:403364041